jgi:hypothetical protein
VNWLTFTLVSLVSTAALAEPAVLPMPQVVTYPPGDDNIVVLRKGEASPFTGQLFDDNTALRWAVWLQQYKAKYGIDLQAAQATCKVKLDHADELAAIEFERASKTEADLRKRLQDADALRLKLEEELRNPGFFKSPGFWYGLGVGTTIVAVVATAYVVHETK